MGAKPGREKIFLHEITAMNSFLPEWATVTGTETVEVATVDGVIAQHGIDLIHFLKIDTEGYELEVLAGAHGALQSSRVALIQVEVGFDQMKYKRFATLDDIKRHLAPTGYILYGVYKQCRAKACSPEQ